MVVVAGAGMAGLVCAARLRELGAGVRVLERGDRPGGSMLLSSGFVWRHRTLEGFREECPGGDRDLQALIVERLDDGLDWLERRGPTALERDTGNPRTVGCRFDTAALTQALARSAGDVRLGEPIQTLGSEPTVLATGGFGGALARRLGVPLRANPWSDGDGIALARGRGAAVTAGMAEFYGRALPAPPAVVTEVDFVRASQLYGRFAHVVDDNGRAAFDGEPSWSENDLVQSVAALPGATAWYILDSDALGGKVRERTVSDMIAVAEALGGEVRRSGSQAGLDLGAPASPKLRRPPFTAMHVIASVTHTIGGLRIDRRARVLREDGSAVEGLYAIGVDAGGVATGGYASGLAAALVLGLAAAEAIAG